LKPGNLFITAEGRLKIFDFGIAKLVSAPGESRTETEGVLGTMGYMAPEQLRGQQADRRADVFAFGAILYEMLCGRRAFERASDVEAAYAILNDEPPDLPAAVPPSIAAVVRRCLEKSSDRRFQSARELADALRAPSPPADLAHRARSIAVLPFLNISTDPDNEYFSDGMTEELLGALAKIEGLKVPSRTSCFAFKGPGQDVREIARRLGVSTVLEGSVRKAGKRVRIATQLIDAENGYQLWTETYDRHVDDVFALQDEIARTIVDALQVRLAPRRRARRATEDPEAYQLYLRGRYHWNRRPTGIPKAIEYLEQAIERDPQYGLAYAGLADCYLSLGLFNNGGLPPRVAMPKAMAAAGKALELDAELAEPHSTIGGVKLHYEWDLPGAEAELRRALEKKPGYGPAHHLYAHALVSRGRLEDALAESRRFIELEPLDAIPVQHLEWHYWMAHEWEAMWETSRNGLVTQPSPWHHFYLGCAGEQLGRLEEAIPALREARAALAGAFAAAALAHALGTAGEAAQARAILAELHERAPRSYVGAYDFAIVHLGLGERDEAFRWLDKAVDERSSWLAYLAHDPRIDPLHGDTRFARLLERVGLPLARIAAESTWTK
jgi:serine/threonine-protein kinase